MFFISFAIVMFFSIWLSLNFSSLAVTISCILCGTAVCLLAWRKEVKDKQKHMAHQQEKYERASKLSRWYTSNDHRT